MLHNESLSKQELQERSYIYHPIIIMKATKQNMLSPAKWQLIWTLRYEMLITLCSNRHFIKPIRKQTLTIELDALKA